MLKVGGFFVLIDELSTVTRAQATLSAADIYHIVGQYSQTYFRSNLDVSRFVGNPGSNYWDFSQPQATNEVISRMDVVPVSDGGHGAIFTGATFALRYQGGAISGTTWEYYQLDPTNGLVFYGTYEPVGYGANPSVPITPPTTALPVSLHYGDSWKSSYTFSVTDPLLGAIPVSYTSTSTVDAYGTLALPGIGLIPTLRITQVEDYEENIFGLTYPQFDTNWLWLAQGIGYAAQAVAFSPDTYSPSAQTYTNSFSRAFLYPPLPSSCLAQLTLQSNVAILSWSAITNANGYVVQSSTDLTLVRWSLLAQSTNLSISVPTMPATTQQFYRVIGQQ
jgi:hypothetical protein